MKHRRIRLACLLLVLLSPFAIFWLMTPRPVSCPVDVRLETFEQLKAGMSEGEFEAILGAPAGDYRTRKDDSYLFPAPGTFPCNRGETTEREWLTDEAAIRVFYDAEGKAVYFCRGVKVPSPSLLRRLQYNLEKLAPGN
jgi:hypothetical protein